MGKYCKSCGHAIDDLQFKLCPYCGCKLDYIQIENKTLDFQNKIEQRNQNYKKIYATISGDELNNLFKQTKNYHYSTKEQIVNYLVDESDSDYLQALTYMNNHEYDKAIEIFDSLVNLAKSEHILIEKGICHYNLNQIDEAFACYNKALIINPLNVALLDRIAALHFDLENYLDAMDCCDKIIEIDSDYPGIWTLKSKIYCNLSKLTNNIMECMFLLNKSIICLDNDSTSDYNDSNYWFHKSRIYEEMSEYDNMIACYDKCIEINPDLDIIWNKKGTYFLNHGDVDKALIHFDKAIKINPNNVSYWENRDLCLKHKNND